MTRCIGRTNILSCGSQDSVAQLLRVGLSFEVLHLEFKRSMALRACFFLNCDRVEATGSISTYLPCPLIDATHNERSNLARKAGEL